MTAADRSELSDYQRGAVDALTEAAKTIGLDPASEEDKAVARWLMSQVKTIYEQANLVAGDPA